jgi:hypothetical protein
MKRPLHLLVHAGALAFFAGPAFAAPAGPAPTFVAQDGAPPAKPAVEAPAASKLSAWPKPADKEALLVEIEKLCKAATEEMERTARESLAAAGAASVPFLLDRYGREKVEGARDRLLDVLSTSTDASMTRLLAARFEDKNQPVRAFALWRAAAFPDPELKAAAEKAWTKLAKQGDKADAGERYAAALCCASAGSIAGLEALYEAAGAKWDKKKRELRAALEGARAKEASAWALARVKPDDRKATVAALRLLAGCGVKEDAGAIKGLLDNDDNSIRVATINALRGMVDGEGPLEDISAFEAIETARKWKGRI